MSKMGTIGGLEIEFWLPQIFGSPHFGVGIPSSGRACGHHSKNDLKQWRRALLSRHFREDHVRHCDHSCPPLATASVYGLRRKPKAEQSDWQAFNKQNALGDCPKSHYS
jgi:hypothetical protein